MKILTAWLVGVVLLVIVMMPQLARAQVEESGGEEVGMVVASQGTGSSFWPIRPGVAVKSGGGMYRSGPCGCVDRGLFTTQFVARAHFGWRVAVEADLRLGSMLLGGRFPSQGWALGGRVAFWEPGRSWWNGFYLRGGFRQWEVMGMRAFGTSGVYGGVNWEVKLFRHLFVEADIVGGRTFQEMQHWYVTGLVGVSARL